jgi:flagellin
VDVPISIGSNIASLGAQRELSQSTDELARVYERLSSGQRINRASDDAAGLAIASQLTANSRVFTQAIRNVNDGISATSIAEGALNALQEITQRQTELAEEAANGSYSSQQRTALNNEANALVNEYNRIISTTSFNGLSLLDGTKSQGTITIQAGSGANSTISISIGSSLAPGGSGASGTLAGGNFASGPTENLGFSPASIQTANISGSGLGDIVTNTKIFLSNGDGTFKAGVAYSAQGGYASFGDVNGDGKADLISISGNNINVQLGNGNGTFQADTQTAVDTSFGSVTGGIRIGDFNGDGLTDVVLSTYDNSVNGNYLSSIQAYFGSGSGALVNQTFVQTLSGVDYGQYVQAVGDFNSDGRSDILFGGLSLVDGTYLGQSDGSFAGAAPFSTTSTGPFYSLNGYSELLTSNGGGGIHIVGPFGNATNVGSIISNKIVVGDFNGDGNTDIVGISAGGTAELSLGNGNGTFNTGITFIRIGDRKRIRG